MEQCHEIHRWDESGLRGQVVVRVTAKQVAVEEYTVGTVCEELWRSPDHEEKFWVDAVGAMTLLRHLDIDPGPEPLPQLARHLAESLRGCSDATSRFRDLARAAGARLQYWSG